MAMPPASQQPMVPLTSEAIQKKLDENQRLIFQIMEFQKTDKQKDSLRLQQQLHTNLLFLATHADQQVQQQANVARRGIMPNTMGASGISPAPPQSSQLSMLTQPPTPSAAPPLVQRPAAPAQPPPATMYATAGSLPSGAFTTSTPTHINPQMMQRPQALMPQTIAPAATAAPQSSQQAALTQAALQMQTPQVQQQLQLQQLQARLQQQANPGVTR
eukprot:TRINITY_DN14977_c0_g1_i1.p1 TRINITY_DN14977_c0_g1~~TRINITY_DN14977_c0_g1_i1.p1  ORF type:complete len:246 (-),score=54.42 TRINITY_DN14977_c0_g1_i1:119-766(-)